MEAQGREVVETKTIEGGLLLADILGVAPEVALTALSSATALVEAVTNARRPVPRPAP
jgi:hypothetical protein